MKTESQKLRSLLGDERLLPSQKELIKEWVNHLRTYKDNQYILDLTYVLREFGIYINKPFEGANLGDLRGYLGFKLEGNKSITGNRVLDVKKQSVNVYRYKINRFYRWILKNRNIEIDKELAYPTPKVIKKVEVPREELCRRRVIALLNNELISLKIEDKGLTQKQLSKKYDNLILDESNLRFLKGYYDYKITSGKVESHTGFVGKLYFIKRLGLYLDKQRKTYKQATREDIQGFLSDVQKDVNNKNGNGEKFIINLSYKAHLLDFYRFVYGMFEEEQPRKYPKVVSWLYQKRKKGHDKIPKEIITNQEMEQMIVSAIETRDKALISLFSDCSARVSEIVNAKISDVKVNEISAEGSSYKHSIATIILRGKTGERKNQLFYSVPHLRVWLMNHPRKDDKEAPLFVATNESRFGQGLTAVGINKILQRTARKAGISRHIHAHLFRHTNLTRMAKLLSETELKIHAGWGSNSKMASVYVHLNQQDVANKILEKYGLKPKEEEEQESQIKFKICPNTLCSNPNPKEAQFCLKCGYPLTLNTAISMAKVKKKEDELQDELFKKDISKVEVKSDIREALYQILKSDPKLIERLKEIVEISKN